MSLFISSIGKGAIAFIAGVTVIAPTAYVLSNSRRNTEEQFKLEKKEDFDECLVVVEGNSEESREDDDGTSNRRLLACQSSLNTRTNTNFYLWSKGDTNELRKEVSHVKVEPTDGPKKFTLTLIGTSSSTTTETMLVSNNGDYLNGLNIKKECRVDFSKKQITCNKKTQQLSLQLKNLSR